MSAAPEAALRIVERGPDDAARAVVFLHGYGGDASPYASMVEQLPQERLLLVIPRGPVPTTTGFGWWDIGDWRAEGDFRDAMPEGLFVASERIRELVDGLVARGIERRCIVVSGFSQGAVLALDVGLHSEPPLAGIAALSGTLVARPRWASVWSSSPPIFMSHGRADRVLPFRYADAFRQELEDAGAPLTFLAYDGEHTVTQPVVVALREFVQRSTERCI